LDFAVSATVYAVEFLDQELTPYCSTYLVVVVDIVVVVVLLAGLMLFKLSLRCHHFKSDWDEIWQNRSSSKCALIDGVGF